jgi:hypothetical protein
MIKKKLEEQKVNKKYLKYIFKLPVFYNSIFMN